MSTDPAHSLGDVWRTSFTNTPSSPLENLHVMELDPKQMMDSELESWLDYANQLTGEHQTSDHHRHDDRETSMAGKINSFQEWLAGIPGIDEATALSAAITHIESGNYDIIVFDTAPTGHTLKLLSLPHILEQGIEKLQSWQTKLWGYWDTFKSFTKQLGPSSSSSSIGPTTSTSSSSSSSSSSTSSSTTNKRSKHQLRNEITQKMIQYKQNIQKVGNMLQDQHRTRFIIVCIAEFLSVSETQRLLQELQKHHIRASHIIVNQLVIHHTLSHDELVQLESMAEIQGFQQMNTVLIHKMLRTCQLTAARKKIQQKYLKMLKGYEETQQHFIEGICEIPLMAEEVTGSEAIFRFAQLLLCDSSASKYKNHHQGDKNDEMKIITNKPNIGDIIRIAALLKNEELNGVEGEVDTIIDETTGRCGISIVDPKNGKRRKLALQPKNISIVRRADPTKVSSSVTRTSSTTTTTEKSSTEDTIHEERRKNNNVSSSSLSPSSNHNDNNIMSKAMKVLEDPEIKAMIEKDPRVKAAIEDCLENPINFMKYMTDPELSQFMSKAMSKLG